MTLYYLLTILKEEQLYGNVYETQEELVAAHEKFSPLYPVRAFMLDDEGEGKKEVYLARIKSRLIMCLGPKTDVGDEYIACTKKELRLSTAIDE